MHRVFNELRHWGKIPVLILVIVTFAAAPSWSKSRRLQGNAYGANGQGYTEDRMFKRWVAFQNKGNTWKDYENLSPEEKATLKKKYRQWNSLPPEKQKILRRRMNRFKDMPPEDRKLYQQRFNQWQKLSPAERNKLRQKLRKWDRLTPQEQENIRRRFRND